MICSSPICFPKVDRQHARLVDQIQVMWVHLSTLSSIARGASVLHTDFGFLVFGIVGFARKCPSAVRAPEQLFEVLLAVFLEVVGV